LRSPKHKKGKFSKTESLNVQEAKQLKILKDDLLLNMKTQPIDEDKNSAICKVTMTFSLLDIGWKRVCEAKRKLFDC
jgi:hypothetical protein